MRPLIERMLRSTDPEVCEAGARLAGVAALEHAEAADLVEEALRTRAQFLQHINAQYRTAQVGFRLTF